jgi:hypothetical protein
MLCIPNPSNTLSSFSRREKFDAVVFGSTLARDTCWQLAGVFRTRNSKGKIIEVLPSDWATPKNRPDATVLNSDELPETIRSLLT